MDLKDKLKTKAEKFEVNKITNKYISLYEKLYRIR